FDGYASQRNAALHGLGFRHDWVLIVDADERIPEACAAELRRFAADPPARASAARLRRRDFLMGTWLRHAQISPFYIRLVRPDASATSVKSMKCSGSRGTSSTSTSRSITIRFPRA
ncbi:MAG TPA: hypothetical protein VMC81_04845, partial [Rhodocyclaceae bacterium]|nr:hypothetical protein [Rhodocyclaceae bacterium]